MSATSPAPHEYRIESLYDFFDVPLGKQDACLADFAVWLAACREIRETFGDLVEITGFIWVDDGETGFSGLEIGGKRDA